MSSGNDRDQLNSLSSNPREFENRTNYTSSRHPFTSSLRASAPEFEPTSRNQGAVRKRPQKFNQEYRNSYSYSRYPSSDAHFQATTTEFNRSNENGGARKKSWKDKNRYGNWRLDDTNSRSRNSRYNNDSRRYDEFEDKTSREDRSKFSHDKRNGYTSRSFNRYNQIKNFTDRPYSASTENYNAAPPKKSDRHKLYSNKMNTATASQRERLTEMLDSNLLECMVCCERIKRIDKVWSCTQCYHIIHLNCIVAWAESSKVNKNWRCPACQNVYAKLPNQYICYCGKIVDPKSNPNVIAHGCDNMCLRKGKNCDHKCNILCHPGPCPDCTVMVSKPCGCGVTQQVVKCCSEIHITCSSVCNKFLNCGLHKCVASCHEGPCAPCKNTIIQECYCGKTGRKVLCDKDTVGVTTFICDNNCDKLLTCGNHKCQKPCHAGPCDPCETDVQLIKYCYCGKTLLKNPRQSCLDPIPCCDKVCGKFLICGPPSNPHACEEKCHNGKCPPCSLTTFIKCRCGHMDKEIACAKLTTKADDARCEKKCTKKRLCGKHTCKQKCCIEIEHVCPLPCNKLLTCGLHKCELTCHSGRCPTCMETSFEELYCECGESVLYPPIPCGTKPPLCTKPCSKPRSCGHPPNHDCHPGSCPPCFVLTNQWCFGKHETRAAIPCEQNSFSCGLACGKPMPCGRHKCNKPCHEGDCPVPCVQPCIVSRMLCGHPCNKPCHNPPCPESNCKYMVPVTCQCGLQKSSKVCMDLTDEYRNLEMAQLQSRMSHLSNNKSVIDISDLTPKKPSVLKILECNDECKIVERNRRLAIGLQIQNPDLGQKLTPRYSDFLKQWAKKDPKFCQRIHDKLTELVQLAKQSKQKSRSYSFESMNRDKRHFIHEYSEYFGVDSAAYDAEPNRNVVATAIKDKSWLPGMSVLEVLQRENGQRKVPGPVLGYSVNQDNDRVSLKLLKKGE